MPWTSPRRDLVLQAVLEEVDRRLDGRLPMDVSGVDQTFRDEHTLANVLQVRWQAALAAQVEHALAEDPDDPQAAVVRAWRRTVRALPGVRMVLDGDWERADERRRATLERRRARQHQWLAQQAGHVVLDHPLDEEAVALGAALEAEGRRYYRPGRRPSPPPLLKRLKAVLAA
ncbi:hypothetical protein [Nocardioides daphniae]|uniref:Uncharacterized protein n=1 Tax=Nocardioides daphniae TaxID=402297 RepID=A0A4P7U9L4_9ACTN|nr:hypothetical protein [Nocardioides daphniae]QCC76740.1 hypothetical protein E2C04_05005 [Nocardioides daphniae]GGD15862.1 hypothetical protein GCM10007231_13620 [Nocardioides daphniae]